MIDSPSPSLVDRALRLVASAAHRLMRLGRFVRRPRPFGAHALALTPEGKVILVKLRYAPGWRLPGGGHGEDEEVRDAVLRELREEIGMTAHGTVRGTGIGKLLIVEDVRYAPRKWSWEVEAIMEAAMDNLPADLSPRAAGWLAAIRDEL